MSKPLVIDRAEWLHGEGDSDSALHRTRDGKKCCLGFYLLACGLSITDITHSSRPSSVVLPEEALWLVGRDLKYDSRVCESLMTANDSTKLKAVDRERRIRDLFKSKGISVTFKGASR